MPKIINEYIDAEICTHFFDIDCCGYIVTISYSLDWRELNSSSLNEILGLYRCPICKSGLNKKDISKKLRTPRHIRIKIDIRGCQFGLFRKGVEEKCNKPAKFVKYYLDEDMNFPPVYLCGLHKFFSERLDKRANYNTKYVEL